MTCQQCYREIPYGSQTCPYCGKFVSQPQWNGQMPPQGYSFAPPYGQPLEGPRGQMPPQAYPEYNQPQQGYAQPAPQMQPPPRQMAQPPMVEGYPAPVQPQYAAPAQPMPQAESNPYEYNGGAYPAPAAAPIAPVYGAYNAQQATAYMHGYPSAPAQPAAEAAPQEQTVPPHQTPFAPPPAPAEWPPQNGMPYPEAMSLGTGLKGVPACAPEGAPDEVQFMRTKADFRRGVNDHVPGVAILTNYRLIFMRLSQKEILTHGIMADYAEGSFFFDIPLAEVHRIEECDSGWRYAVLVNEENLGTMLYFNLHDEWMGALRAAAAPYIDAREPQEQNSPPSAEGQAQADTPAADAVQEEAQKAPEAEDAAEAPTAKDAE